MWSEAGPSEPQGLSPPPPNFFQEGKQNGLSFLLSLLRKFQVWVAVQWCSASCSVTSTCCCSSLQGYLSKVTARHSPGLLVPSAQAASAKGPAFHLSWENGAPSFPVFLEIEVLGWGAREMWARCSCVGEIKHLQIRKREACGVEWIQSSDSLGSWHWGWVSLLFP